MSEDLELGNQWGSCGDSWGRGYRYLLDVFLGVLVKGGFKTVPRKEIQEKKYSHWGSGSPAGILKCMGVLRIRT